MMKTVLLIVSASLLLSASSVVVSATKPITESFDVEIYAKGEMWRSMSLKPSDLPGEYSYTLPAGTSGSLHGRGYRFRVSATGTTGGSATADSPAFDRP